MDWYWPTIADYFRLWIRCYVGRKYKPLSITRRNFYLILLEGLIFDQTCGFYLRFKNELWILFGSKRPIADYFCGSDVTPAVHKPLSITRRSFYLIFVRRPDFWPDLRLLFEIYQYYLGAKDRLLLWIRCYAGRTQTALNYKMRLLFDLRLSRFVAAVCVRKVKAPFLQESQSFLGFHICFWYLSFYMFLMHYGAKQSWIH